MEVKADAWAVDAACSGNPGQMEYRVSVAMKPGATALTVTFRLASSLARLLVRPIRPALLAE